MKRITLISLSIFICAITFAQNNYYWSAGKKHYLKENPDMFIVKFSGTDKVRVQNFLTLQNNKEIRYLTLIKDNLGIIVAGGGYFAYNGKA